MDFMLGLLLEQRILQVDNLIDYIFEHVNALLLENRFQEVDDMLRYLCTHTAEYTEDALLSFLTITNLAEGVLPSRGEFYDAVTAEFDKRQIEDREIILSGLENKVRV